MNLLQTFILNPPVMVRVVRLLARFGIVLGMCGNLIGQDFNELSEVKLMYWRAFHGTIELLVRVDDSSRYVATVSIFWVKKGSGNIS